MSHRQPQAFFNKRLAEAKKAVPEPPQQKVKLKMPTAKSPEPTQPKIMLRVGGQKASPALTSGISAGITVDNEALERQKHLVKTGANGQGATIPDGISSHPGSGNTIGPSATGAAQPSQAKDHGASAMSRSPSTNGVKTEGQLGQSPALGAVQLRRPSDGSDEAGQSPRPASSTMPPPSGVTPRLPSGSPLPQVQGHSGHVPQHPTTNVFDSKWRQPGKGKLVSCRPSNVALTAADASDALISNLSISTHPGLKIKHHFHLDVPPSPTQSQQSITINLPSTHYYLRIIPTIAHNLSHRQSKLFVTANLQRLNPIPQRPEEADSRRPLYETRVSPGVNRIEVEMIAGPARGAPKLGSGQEIELEKITVFANVLRA